MTILVIGSTGHVGSELVKELARRDADVRALSEHPALHGFPDGVEAIKGDLTDSDSMRSALRGIRTLFLLNPVAPDELTRSLLTINLALEAGIERFVYQSMIKADAFLDTPHAAAKHGTEQMFARYGLSAIVLRPNFFFQNDEDNKAAIMGEGIYPLPIGGLGAAAVDVRDIAEVAAMALIDQESARAPLPSETIEIVGPEVFTGGSIAALWSDVLGRTVRYAGDDLAAFEKRMKTVGPGWMAYDTALMFRGFQREGYVGLPDSAEKLVARLGRPLRTYRAYAEETAREWLAPSLGERVGNAATGVATMAGKIASTLKGDA